MENGNKREQEISVLVDFAVSRIFSEHIVEHVLLVVTKVYLRQHNLLST